MLGHRGCRLAVSYPEIAEMQARAIFEAVAQVKKDTGKAPFPEVMIPLITGKPESIWLQGLIAAVHAKVRPEAETGDKIEYLCGTMIELPRACLKADEIAEAAEFFSFGTNDLTQTTFGISRDDSARFMEDYIRNGVMERDPFISIDTEGVGELVSRLLVLGASGNLRGVFSIAIIAVTALATYSGVLVPLRDTIGSLWSTAAIGGNDLLFHAGLERWAGIAFGAVLALAALGFALRARLSPWRLSGGIMIGLTVAAGWYFTWQLSTQVFEPIQAESLSFIRPLATTGELALASGFAGLDQGVLIGAILGAFAAALMSGEFRISTFAEPGTPSIWRYAAGSVLMGFGGILAVGCTIGAGLTGGSVLAVSSLLGLASMIAGAALTQLLLRSLSREHPATAAVAPAE
jgi:hypothetical protein